MFSIALISMLPSKIENAVVSEIIDLVLQNTTVFEECRKLVFEISRESWHHSSRENRVLRKHHRESYKKATKAIFLAALVCTVA